MRIAIVTEHVNRRGGQERVVCELAERLSRYHEVHLYCFSAQGLRGERLSVHKMWCPFHSSTLEGFWILIASWFALRNARFDAIMSQGGNSLIQNCLMLHTCHALRAERTQAVEWRYHPPNPIKRLVQWFRSRAFLYFEGRAVRKCRGAVMTVSRFLKDYVMAQHGLADAEVQVTENGVDHDVFRPETRKLYRNRVRDKLGIPRDAFVVLFLGGRWFDKGVPFLIEALGKMPDRNAHLVIVGKGDVGFFSEFARDNGVEDRVRFVAPTGSPQWFYGMADCFGFPSDAEGFPLVIGEAASCGLPLITTAVGGSEHLVEEGVSGYIVPPDADVIAERLQTLAADPALLAKMRRAVHRKASKLSWDNQAEQVRALLEAWFDGDGAANSTHEPSGGKSN